MKYSVVLFALLSVAAADMTKVVRSDNKPQKLAGRQAAAKVQNSAMTTVNGDVVPFDTAGVNMDSVAKGL